MARKALHLLGGEREEAIAMIRAGHYLGTVPSGKSHYLRFGPCLVVYSLPANYHLARFLLGSDAVNGQVWEVSRLWAPDGHEPNLLTQALSKTTGAFRQLEREVQALVAYADPNAGHHGGVYRAASWVYCGRCRERRLWRSSEGQLVARRAFHSGGQHLNKGEIEALGYTEERAPGKTRWARGLTKGARTMLHLRFSGLMVSG